MIYRGSTRTVVTFGPLAFKFGRGKNGMRCNRHEADLYRRSVKPAFRFPCLDLLGACRSIGGTMPERRPGGIACRVGSRSDSTAGRVREGAASHLHTPRLDNHRSVTKPQVPNNLARSTREMAACLRDTHREPRMSNPFFDRPILNSPYEYPRRHWELDDDGQPTRRS